jgi:hypothetical protein
VPIVTGPSWFGKSTRSILCPKCDGQMRITRFQTTKRLLHHALSECAFIVTKHTSPSPRFSSAAHPRDILFERLVNLFPLTWCTAQR